MQLSDLLEQSSLELLEHAEELQVEDASTMRKLDLTFAIIEKSREQGRPVTAEGVLDVIPRSEFGFLRLALNGYAPGPYDIYVSRTQVRKFWLQTGDIVSGEIRAPREKEGYCALLKVNAVNFDDPAKASERTAGIDPALRVSQSDAIEMLGL